VALPELLRGLVNHSHRLCFSGLWPSSTLNRSRLASKLATTRSIVLTTEEKHHPAAILATPRIIHNPLGAEPSRQLDNRANHNSSYRGRFGRQLESLGSAKALKELGDWCMGQIKCSAHTIATWVDGGAAIHRSGQSVAQSQNLTIYDLPDSIDLVTRTDAKAFASAIARKGGQ